MSTGDVAPEHDPMPLMRHPISPRRSPNSSRAAAPALDVDRDDVFSRSDRDVDATGACEASEAGR